MTILGSRGDEAAITDRWLAATLGARTALTAELLHGAASIHNTEAPPGPDGDPPCVVFQFQGGADVGGNGPFRILTNGLWLVKGICSTRDFLDVETIANEIDNAIDAGAGTEDGSFIFSCVREQPYRRAYTDATVPFREVGGIYRILAQRPPT